jgi:ribosomal-protein-alanine N-acetyltransferase
MEIKTERLFLRTITESDSMIVRDLDVTKGEFETEADALEWIRWVKKTNDEGRLIVNFYIWLAESNQCIGRVYIHSEPELNGDVEIGYGINEDCRNRGYATEAAKAVVKFAFEEAGSLALSAIVKSDNISSRRVIEKLGFTYLGIRAVLDEGENVDFDYFKLLRIE